MRGNIDGSLEGLTRRIAKSIHESGRCLIQPPEVALLAAMGDKNLREFAAKNGWMVVHHLGGEQIEFFKAVPGQMT